MRLGSLVVCKLAVKLASEAELQSSSMSIGILHMSIQSHSQDAKSEPEVRSPGFVCGANTCLIASWILGTERTEFKN